MNNITLDAMNAWISAQARSRCWASCCWWSPSPSWAPPPTSPSPPPSSWPSPASSPRARAPPPSSCPPTAPACGPRSTSRATPVTPPPTPSFPASGHPSSHSATSSGQRSPGSCTRRWVAGQICPWCQYILLLLHFISYYFIYRLDSNGERSWFRLFSYSFSWSTYLQDWG